MTAKKWLKRYLAVQSVVLLVLGGLVVIMDPFFHYHEPLEMFYYTLDNQRSQNNGIIKHFEYDAIITGSSMIENAKTSEVNQLFGVNTIKLPYSGGSYKEIDEAIKLAIKNKSDLRLVIRCLDMSRFFDDKESMRLDLGTYPEYLYNENVFDDVNYVLNKDVILKRCAYMIMDWLTGAEGGITSFDEYSYWDNEDVLYGKEVVLGARTAYIKTSEEKTLTEEEKKTIEANIRANVVATAKANPQIEFYYYISPYSIVWWGDVWQSGALKKQIEAEKLILELMLECENIKIYSFNNFSEITVNLDNYSDEAHYGSWINSEILRFMSDDLGRITKENYKEYLEKEYEFYSMFDYNRLCY